MLPSVVKVKRIHHEAYYRYADSAIAHCDVSQTPFLSMQIKLSNYFGL